MKLVVLSWSDPFPTRTCSSMINMYIRKNMLNWMMLQEVSTSGTTEVTWIWVAPQCMLIVHFWQLMRIIMYLSTQSFPSFHSILEWKYEWTKPTNLTNPLRWQKWILCPQTCRLYFEKIWKNHVSSVAMNILTMSARLSMYIHVSKTVATQIKTCKIMHLDLELAQEPIIR